MAEQEGDRALRVTESPAFVAPTTNFVKYIGAATVRIVRVDEWPATVPHDKRPDQDVVWEFGNNFTLKKSEFSKEAAQVLKDDGSFVISDN